MDDVIYLSDSEEGSSGAAASNHRRTSKIETSHVDEEDIMFIEEESTIVSPRPMTLVRPDIMEIEEETIIKRSLLQMTSSKEVRVGERASVDEDRRMETNVFGEELAHRDRSPLFTAGDVQPSTSTGQNEDVEIQEINVISVNRTPVEAAISCPKRQKRTKEQIQAEKLEKEMAQAAKKRAREEAKQKAEADKERRQLEREIGASNKSKKEHYMFCHISKDLCAAIDGLETATRMVFLEKELTAQVEFDGSMSGLRFEFRRKCLEALIGENGRAERFEYTDRQRTFGLVLTGDSFREIVQSRTVDDVVRSEKLQFSLGASHLILVVIGAHSTHENTLHPIRIRLYEEQRVQVHFVANAQALADLLVRLHRGVAKTVDRGVRAEDKPLYHVEKGVKEGFGEDLVLDWWDKMLALMPRMADSQRRAVLKALPNPLKARKQFIQNGEDWALNELSNLIGENGRRLGPALARRIYVMLTDDSGQMSVE